MYCPRSFADIEAGKDPYEEYNGERCCTYCGSLHPERFMTLIKEGVRLIPTDKSYKAYLECDPHGMQKFYYEHLNDAQMQEFVSLFAEYKIKMSDRFYVLPYFMRYRAAHG